MYLYVVDDIEKILLEAFEEEGSIVIEAILWSIDARHRLIPEVKEINDALLRIKTYRLIREPEVVKFERGESPCSEKVTSQDLELGIKHYEKVLAKGLP